MDGWSIIFLGRGVGGGSWKKSSFRVGNGREWWHCAALLLTLFSLGKLKGACWPLCYNFSVGFLKALQHTLIKALGWVSRWEKTSPEQQKKKNRFASVWTIWNRGFLSLASTSSRQFLFLFAGQLRSWTSPPSGRSTSPHCSTRRSPPYTPPTSVASCRCLRPLPRHACSEPCPKWKRIQGWER